MSAPVPEDAGHGAEERGFDPGAVPGGVRAALEAVLMVVDAPAPAARLASALGLPEAEVVRSLEELAQEYRADRRGFELRRTAAGWRVYSRPDVAPLVQRFVVDGQSARLSRAALETLAVIAYRQPVTRGRVAAVRGVDVDGVVRTLVARGLVEEEGTDPASGALLYRTSAAFLERTGLGGLDELPPLAPFLPADDQLDELDDLMGSDR
ncbi:SMC-Scp complex subunit ScpB [Quadrisphaera sp. DSM 44207]|uniref:SMC-Scp complex subunit ScpB n=1 Tax=Quadrisphaera sp. DSM 44207 TaxID=1881057 RepID=UPI00088141BC|nr:SMC-Scp complex subunit ScpB [Quadrisphaera sp. DSM 44207]SDQ38971.1 condensin subunit ScpB [Quadrisphaera sp. DSM 44207]